MFTFDAIEKSLYNGISPDRVPDAIKNHFSMVFGNDALDNRLQVKISKRQVRFFYYDYDYGKDDNGKDKWNPNGVKDNDYLKEVGFITLTRAKDTGNDILGFPQNIGNLYLYKEVVYEPIKKEKYDPVSQECYGLWASMNECIGIWKTEYEDFPFITEYNNKVRRWEEKLNELNEKIEKEERQGNVNENKLGEYKEELQFEKQNLLRCTICCFLQCCLLSFVYEFENRWQNFGASPIYDDVRDKLRESDVYKMLSAKIQYTQYLYKGQYLSRNQEKYTYYTQKFADCLMDKRLNKVISPDNYGDEDGKQGWFFDPETELEHILSTNRKHDKERNKEKSGGTTREYEIAALKDSLVSKIRSFLYTKHSVCNAKTSTKSKNWFKAAQFLMCAFNVLFILALSGFTKSCWDWFYDSFWLVYLLAFVMVAFCILRSACFNGKEYINAFFPRIVVAEAAAWLTIGIAEDLVKSMLWTEEIGTIVVALFAVLILVGILIFGEAKQHSPYFKKGENITKTLLVLNHSIFFALILGCLMQIVFYDNLLKTSNVLSDVVYKAHFDNVDNYLQQLEDLEKNINDYQRFTQDYSMSLSGMSGDNSGQVKLKGKVVGSKDTMDIILYNKLVFQSAFINSFKSPKNVVNYHDKLIVAVNNSTTELNNLWGKDSIQYIVFNKRFQKCEPCDSIKPEIIEANNTMLGEILPILHEEIRSARSHCMIGEYDTLLSWSTVGTDSIKSDSYYLRKIINENKSKLECCRAVGWWQSGNSRFYPTLLIMHTLIVLVLAFITQLIISDKSVTEPL